MCEESPPITKIRGVTPRINNNTDHSVTVSEFIMKKMSNSGKWETTHLSP